MRIPLLKNFLYANYSTPTPTPYYVYLKKVSPMRVRVIVRAL